jgi:hypothetical protein
MNLAREHCWKHCLGLEDSDGVLNMVEDKVEGCHPLHVPDGEGATLLYQQVNNLHCSQVPLACLKIHVLKSLLSILPSLQCVYENVCVQESLAV